MAARLIMSADNAFNRVGARVHDVTHPHWRQDMEILVGIAGSRLPFITLPKPCSAGDVRVQLEALRDIEREHGVDRRIPVHVLIETHGALRDSDGEATMSLKEFERWFTHLCVNVYHQRVHSSLARAQFSALPEDARKHANIELRPIDTLVISPSERLDKMAADYAHTLPRSIRTLLRGIGAMNHRGGALTSYLLFEKPYTRALIDLGYADAMQRSTELGDFLNL